MGTFEEVTKSSPPEIGDSTFKEGKRKPRDPGVMKALQVVPRWVFQKPESHTHTHRHRLCPMGLMDLGATQGQSQ